LTFRTSKFRSKNVFMDIYIIPRINSDYCSNERELADLRIGAVVVTEKYELNF